MGWADRYIEDLKCGQIVQFRPRGNSMSGKIESGQLCTVEPIFPHTFPKKGDIVLCKVKGRQYLHLITAIRGGGTEMYQSFALYQISNNRGRINGWINRHKIYGICVNIEN